MNRKNIVWGLFFILLAVYALFGQTVPFAHLGVLSLGAGVILAAVMVHSLSHLNFFGVFVPMALLYNLLEAPLDLPRFSVWLLLFAGVLLSIGFGMLFHRHAPKQSCQVPGEGSTSRASRVNDDNNPYAKVSFGSASTYLHGQAITSGQFFCSFGNLELFFDQAQLSPEGAELYLDCSFGAIKLFVPRHWRVTETLRLSLAGLEHDVRMAQTDDASPRLSVTGSVHLGSVEIVYI